MCLYESSTLCMYLDYLIPFIFKTYGVDESEILVGTYTYRLTLSCGRWCTGWGWWDINYFVGCKWNDCIINNDLQFVRNIFPKHSDLV